MAGKGGGDGEGDGWWDDYLGLGALDPVPAPEAQSAESKYFLSCIHSLVYLYQHHHHHYLVLLTPSLQHIYTSNSISLKLVLLYS